MELDGQVLYLLAVVENNADPTEFQVLAKEPHPSSPGGWDKDAEMRRLRAVSVEHYKAWVLRTLGRVGCAACNAKAETHEFCQTIVCEKEHRQVITWIFGHCANTLCAPHIAELKPLVIQRLSTRMGMVPTQASALGYRPCAQCWRMQRADEPKFMRCSRCHSVYYCSVACQRLSWPDHRDVCQAEADREAPRIPKTGEAAQAQADAAVVPVMALLEFPGQLDMEDDVVTLESKATLAQFESMGTATSSVLVGAVRMDVMSLLKEKAAGRRLLCSMCHTGLPVTGNKVPLFVSSMALARPPDGRVAVLLQAKCFFTCREAACRTEADRRALAPPTANSRTVLNDCVVCQRHSTLGRPFRCCGRCKARAYCSEACQKVDWPVHKVGCRAAEPEGQT